MDQAVTFRDLSSSDPDAGRALAERVRRSGLAWLPDRPETTGTASRLVIAVAVWSRYDLRLLDLVNGAIARVERPAVRVEVFNIDEVASADELQRIFPGIGEVFQTPAVGYWDAGQLKETGSGFFGRQLVGRVLGFDAQQVLEQPTPVAG